MVPVENFNAPLTPLVPAFTVAIISDPVLVAVLAPVVIEIDPPVVTAESPAKV